MDSFDDLIEETILNELGGVGNAIKDKIIHGFNTTLSNVAAKAGSKEAKGRLNLENLKYKLLNSFKEYCGEQRIPFGRASVEDFIDFLRNKIRFGITDDNFDEYAYGQADPETAQHRGDVANIIAQMTADIEAGQQVHGDDLTDLQNIAEVSPGDKSAVQKALWQFARKHPTSVPAMKPVAGLIGKQIAQPQLRLFIENIAKILLKTEQKKYDHGGGGTGTPGAGTPPGAPPFDLNQGTIPVARDARSGWHSKDVADQTKQVGIDLDQLRKWGQEAVRIEADFATHGNAGRKASEEKALVKTIDGKLSQDQCYALSRTLLQLMIAHPRDLGPLLSASKVPGGQGTFQRGLWDIMREMGPPNTDYDAGDLNKKLKVLVDAQGNVEVKSAKLLALVCMCVAKVY